MENKKQEIKCTITFRNIVDDEIKIIFREFPSPCFKYGNQKAIDIKFYVNGKEQFWPEFIDARYIIDYDFKEECFRYVVNRWETKELKIEF